MSLSSKKIIQNFLAISLSTLNPGEKKQNRRDAEIASGANQIHQALEHVPNSQTMTTFETVPLGHVPTETNENIDFGGHNNDDIETEAPPVIPAMRLLCSVCSTREPQPEPTGPRRRKRKTCRVVVDGVSGPYPDTCPGRTNRKNCFLHTCNDPDKKVK